MAGSDIVYYSSLLFCITLGSCYKKITDNEMKRNYGTGLGLLLVGLICGTSIFHSALMIWGNIIIIKCCDRRYIHQLSLAYTWIHLLYMHSNIMNNYIIWIHQGLALKLVGLAFEMNAAMVKRDVKAQVSKVNLGDSDIGLPEPSVSDIIAYSYYFIGIHKGPYYRWKIFDEHFNGPFGGLGNCRIITEQKLKKACVCGLGYWVINMKYSSELYYDDNFYTTYGADLRYLYNIPQLALYVLQYQAVMLLSTSVFTETGFGVYPAKCQPTPGFGPTTQLSFLTLAAGSPEMALGEEYNFTMLKCFDNKHLIFGPKMRESMRSWDMPTRFWFWAYVHKSFLKSNKEVRSAFSFLAWTVWYGPTIPKFIISSTLWVYVHLEEEYSSLYNTGGSVRVAFTMVSYNKITFYLQECQMKLSWDIGFSIMRIFCLLYLTPCFVVGDTNVVLKYYNSIFWIFHFILLILMIFSIIIYKTRRD